MRSLILEVREVFKCQKKDGRVGMDMPGAPLHVRVGRRIFSFRKTVKVDKQNIRANALAQLGELSSGHDTVFHFRLAIILRRQGQTTPVSLARGKRLC